MMPKKEVKRKIVIKKKQSKKSAVVKVPQKSKAGRPRKNASGQVIDPKTGKFKTGRPSSVTKVVLKKLVEAFALGCSDREACAYAEITPTTLYAYQEKNPEFAEHKECLKNLPTFKARKKLVEALNKDVDMAKWWMEKKRKKEFGDEEKGVPPVAMQFNNFKADGYFEDVKK